MKKTTNKSYLPEKTCPVCLRPFNWRKKWAANWEHIKYCSQHCRDQASKKKPDNISGRPA